MRKHVLMTSEDCDCEGFDIYTPGGCPICYQDLRICKVCGKVEEELDSECSGVRRKGVNRTLNEYIKKHLQSTQ